MAWTQRCWQSCLRWVNASNKSTNSKHHPRRRKVTTSMAGLKMVTYIKISPKMVNPRDTVGNMEGDEEEHTDQSLQYGISSQTFEFPLQLSVYLPASSSHHSATVCRHSWPHSHGIFCKQMIGHIICWLFETKVMITSSLLIFFSENLQKPTPMCYILWT